MQEALEFHLEGLIENGEKVPLARGLNYYLDQTDEISGEDIITHISVEIPALALA